MIETLNYYVFLKKVMLLNCYLSYAYGRDAESGELCKVYVILARQKPKYK